MGMSAGGGGGGSLAEINVTPLVDVLLVLLIIFMVTVPMINHGAKLDTPDLSPSTPQDPTENEEKATLFLTKQGKLKFRNKEITKKQLAQLIKTDPALVKTRELYLRAEPSLDYGDVVEIIGIMRRSGIAKLGLVVNPEDVQ